MSRAIRIGVIALFTISVFASALMNAQILDNKGREFLMSFLPNYDATVSIQLHLTSDVATTVTVQYPVNSPTFTTTVPVNPGAITIVNLPVATATGWTAGVVANNSVRAFAAEEFVAYMCNIRPYSSDAALALPIDTYNTTYIILTYYSNLVAADRSEFAVTAAFANTHVTIRPKRALMGGFPANVPFSITLNKGQAFLGQGTVSGSAGDLSGTIVEADKPITVTNGNVCTNVPPSQTYCDHIFEVAHPVQSWGSSALARNLSNIPLGSIYRILASQDNTLVSQDGVAIGTINKGSFLETSRLPGSHIFSADKPVFVAQYMTGIDPGFGDPAMGNLVPPEQYQSAYTFSTVGGSQFAQHYVNIIAQTGDVGSVVLDGSPVSAASFSAISGTSFSSATSSLAQGTHSISAPHGIGITVYGVNEDDSYLYPGGALFQFINPQGDANPPVCAINIAGNTATGSATDNRPSEDVNSNGFLDPGEDLNANGQIDVDTGIFFVVLGPGSTNLALTVDPFTPGDGIVTYSLALINGALPGDGSVVATDGAGNTCSSPVHLGGIETTPPGCSITGIVPGPPKQILITTVDAQSGLASVQVLTNTNCDVTVAPFTAGTTNPVLVTATKINQSAGAVVILRVTDVAGNSTVCDPVYTTLTADVPQEFSLSANYPNPFNPTTSITFNISRSFTGGVVSLKVFDLLGREIKALVSEPLDPGQYSVQWDATNNNGERVQSGVYIYRLIAGEFSATKKMTLLK